MQKVTPEEAQKLIEQGGATVIDVRTPAEFAGGHISGAINIDIYDDAFTEKIRVFPPDVVYVVNCRSGARSAQACSFMNELGFKSALNLEGGIIAWTHAGLPTV